MFGIKFLPHNNVTRNQLDEIISIKSKAWPYSFESQITWMSNNLKETDFHVLLYLDGSLVAYLNLIRIELFINGRYQSAYGVGNVCAKEHGKGWGSELILRINSYITDLNYVGVLFCKKELVCFYSLNDWNLIDKKKIHLGFENDLIETMCLNTPTDFDLIEYFGNIF